MRADVIKITATLLTPYDRQKFGATAEAEKVAKALEDYCQDQTSVTVDKWQAKHTSVEVE